MEEKSNIYKDINVNVAMQKMGMSFWDFLLWLGAILILGWAVLKIFGVIHSPVWVEMIPYIGGGVSVIGGAYKLGKIKSGIEQTEQKVDKLLKIEERFNKIENEHNLCMQGKLNIHNDNNSRTNRSWRRSV